MLRNNQEPNNCFSRAKARQAYERHKSRGLERRLEALLGVFWHNNYVIA
jgi:hypothetical protein